MRILPSSIVLNTLICYFGFNSFRVGPIFILHLSLKSILLKKKKNVIFNVPMHIAPIFAVNAHLSKTKILLTKQNKSNKFII